MEDDTQDEGIAMDESQVEAEMEEEEEQEHGEVEEMEGGGRGRGGNVGRLLSWSKLWLWGSPSRWDLTPITFSADHAAGATDGPSRYRAGIS